MKGLSTAATAFPRSFPLEAAVPIVVLSLFGGNATARRGCWVACQACSWAALERSRGASREVATRGAQLDVQSAADQLARPLGPLRNRRVTGPAKKLCPRAPSTLRARGVATVVEAGW